MEIVTENATSLAWIGDAVMSLAVREHLLSLGYRKAHVLQKKNAVICSAKGQSVMLNTMMDENIDSLIHLKNFDNLYNLFYEFLGRYNGVYLRYFNTMFEHLISYCPIQHNRLFPCYIDA